MDMWIYIVGGIIIVGALIVRLIEKIVVRLRPDIHRKVYIAAKKSGESINAWLNKNLDRVVSSRA
ncbi:hypothetical protein A45J_2621 [hot springs metagenome]|uniref:Uncharacterized protein n=1 Tax=hot springs metagenome TaxID=433727 RepID=A0A5J4L3L2_9ZZZZ